MGILGLSNLSGGAFGQKNLIINGNFDIWQRGEAFVAVTNGLYTADRWRWAHSAGTLVGNISDSVNRPTFAQSGTNSSKVFYYVITTAEAAFSTNEYALITYRLEGFDYKRAINRTCTLSFWVYSNNIGIYSVAFVTGDGTFSYTSEYTIDSANTWEKKSITLTFDQAAATEELSTGIGMKLNWCLGVGSTYQANELDGWQAGTRLGSPNNVNFCDTIGNHIRLSQVQLEVGSEATLFDDRDYATELDLCQRYYEKSFQYVTKPVAGEITGHNGGICYATTSIDVYVPFQARKRITPAIKYWPSADGGAADQWTYYKSGWIAGNVTSAHIYQMYFTPRITTTSVIAYDTYLVSGNWEADAEL